MIKISEVEITFVKPKPDKPIKGHLGFAKFIVNDSICVNGVAIYESLLRKSGIRIVFPNKKAFHKDGTSHIIDLFYPINAGATLAIEMAIAQRIEEINDGNFLDKH